MAGQISTQEQTYISCIVHFGNDANTNIPKRKAL
jgi:hypothetical protein